jgi:hypothetical protein
MDSAADRLSPSTRVTVRVLSTHKFHPTGIIGSALGAIAVLLLLRVTRLEKGRRPV